MAFVPSMAMRSCGFCGLKRAQMQVALGGAEGVTSNGARRFQTVLRCPDCAQLTIVEHNGPTFAPTENRVIRVYPESPETALDVKHLPDDVRQYFNDARRVLDAGVPDAAAVQLRRTLEAAAGHFNVKERVLMRSIERLINEGLVTKSFGGVLHHIRVVGNQGAHASDERVDEATAEIALQFTTQLLRNLFEVPEELRLIAGDDSVEESDGGLPPTGTEA